MSIKIFNSNRHFQSGVILVWQGLALICGVALGLILTSNLIQLFNMNSNAADAKERASSVSTLIFQLQCPNVKVKKNLTVSEIEKCNLISKSTIREPSSATTFTTYAPNPADTLSALAVVMAIVTIVLTMGSSFLLQKQKLLDEIHQKQSSLMELDRLRLVAVAELNNYWFVKNGAIAAEKVTKHNILLSLLMSTESTHRKMASDEISRDIGYQNRSDFMAGFEYYCAVKKYWNNQSEKSASAEVNYFDERKEIRL